MQKKTYFHEILYWSSNPEWEVLSFNCFWILNFLLTSLLNLATWIHSSDRQALSIQIPPEAALYEDTGSSGFLVLRRHPVSDPRSMMRVRSRSVPRKVVRHPSIPPYTCHLTPRAGPLKDLTSNIKTSDIWHLPHSADLDTVAASSWFFLRRIFLPPIVSLGAPLVLCGPAHSCCRRVSFPTLEVDSTFKVRKAALVDLALFDTFWKFIFSLNLA